jgi:hypothetical protein
MDSTWTIAKPVNLAGTSKEMDPHKHGPDSPRLNGDVPTLSIFGISALQDPPDLSG